MIRRGKSLRDSTACGLQWPDAEEYTEEGYHIGAALESSLQGGLQGIVPRTRTLEMSTAYGLQSAYAEGCAEGWCHTWVTLEKYLVKSSLSQLGYPEKCYSGYSG